MPRVLLLFLIGTVLGPAARAQALEAWRLEVGGVERVALVHVPEGARDPEAAQVPVVLAFHGHGGRAAGFARRFALHREWPEALVVYPQGLPTPGKLTDPQGRRPGWQSRAGVQGDRDLALFDALLERARAEVSVDARRVHVTGHSNGGGFTYLLLEERAGLLASVSPSAASAKGRGPAPEEAKAVPVLHAGSPDDELVRWRWQEAALEALKGARECGDGVPWARDPRVVRFPAEEGADVLLFEHEGGHRHHQDHARLAARFFRDHPRPAEPSEHFGVYAILEAKCFGCHGPDADPLAAELRLDLPASYDQRSERGWLIASRADDAGIIASELFYRLGQGGNPEERMPPRDAEPLTPEERQQLLVWVGSKAPWLDAWPGAEPGPVSLELEGVSRVWDAAPHQAFTDLAAYRGQLVLTFREGESHVGGAGGTIRVLSSPDGATWRSRAVLKEEGLDLRDPKVSVTPEGDLLLLTGASRYEGPQLLGRTSKVTRWRPGADAVLELADIRIDSKVAGPVDWLWRLTWVGSTGYGVVYQPEGEVWRQHLVATEDGAEARAVATWDLDQRPSEATLRALPDGSLAALVRREGNAMIGSAPPPFTEWTWKELPLSLGGPELLVLDDGRMLAAGRRSEGEDGWRKRTVLGEVDLAGNWTELAVLPSGGDTSYPGMVLQGSELLVSYYSSHEGKSAIYLARLRLGD
jgi:dienelactone hydrolase